MLRVIIFGCAITTFVVPIVQLSIGFHFVVKDGQSAEHECSAAPDLPLLMAIGGIFALFFLGSAYRLLTMLTSSNNQQSDTAGRKPKLLVGMISFIFGSITLIFFLLIQMRVYQAYSLRIQYDAQSTPSFCQVTVMRGALVLIGLTYICMFLFFAIYILAFVDAYHQRHKKQWQEFEVRNKPENTRF